MSDTPDWVRADCRAWGRQKRRIWEGHDWHGNVDGYAQSLLGRIREERDGAGQGTPAQRWPEVFWGSGLDVQRALPGMPERQYAALHFQYVWNPESGITADRKAAYLGVKRAEYFNVVTSAEMWIFSRLDLVSRPDAQLVEKVSEIVRSALHGGADSAIHSQTAVTCPRKLDFAPLDRTKISLPR